MRRRDAVQRGAQVRMLLPDRDDGVLPVPAHHVEVDVGDDARQGVPILFFFNGEHPDYHQVSDHPDKIDAEKESRIIRLVFYLGLEVANAAERPRWNPESYRRIVGAEN